MRSRCGAGQQSARSYSNTNGSPSANSALTMITLTKPIEIIREALERLGVDLSSVTRTRMFVTDISCWQEIGRAHGEFFGTHPPTTSMVEVRRLIEPEMMIEIEADAIAVGAPRVDGDALV